MTEVLMPFRGVNRFGFQPIDWSSQTQQNLSLIWANKEVLGKSLSYLRCKIEHQTGCRPSTVIQEVFSRIMTGNASSLLSQNPVCGPGEEPMGKCVYSFGDLYECSCPELNRKMNPEQRKIYEDKIIERIKVIASSKDHITITLFASGFLFGELVAIVKMIHFLKEHGWNGKLDLNFIDSKYVPEHAVQSVSEAIQVKEGEIFGNQIGLAVAVLGSLGGAGCAFKAKKTSSKVIAGSVAASSMAAGIFLQNKLNVLEKEMRQLAFKRKLLHPVKEIRMKRERGTSIAASNSVASLLHFLQQAVLSSGITVKTRFFSDAQDYHQLCQTQEKFRCDLLVGSDIDNTLSEIKLLKNTQTAFGAGVVLMKTQQGAKLEEWPVRNREFSNPNSIVGG